jgi:hypothetical protein
MNESGLEDRKRRREILFTVRKRMELILRPDHAKGSQYVVTPAFKQVVVSRVSESMKKVPLAHVFRIHKLSNLEQLGCFDEIPPFQSTKQLNHKPTRKPPQTKERLAAMKATCTLNHRHESSPRWIRAFSVGFKTPCFFHWPFIEPNLCSHSSLAW